MEQEAKVLGREKDKEQAKLAPTLSEGGCIMRLPAFTAAGAIVPQIPEKR